MKVLIVDDEPLARARLRRQLIELPTIEVIGEAENGEQAITACNSLRPQVVLMDIRMPGLDGLSAALQLAQRPASPAVIFCTAYDDYAIEAFDANAVGYLLKPVSQEKLAAALQKAERLSTSQLNALKPVVEQPETRTHITAKSRRGMELIPLSEVRYFLADHKYVTVYHRFGEVLIDDTLKDLEQEFGNKVLRVHRNALVVVEHVFGLERVAMGQYRVKLADIENGPIVSRRHLSDVRRDLEMR
ncbi:MAG TPA: LytTR family DNA-binding domain-containing protein [Spongiibacteraceae bacterium]|nr:LytTR family DNA-binding domain-containing protein [Spongiibacteraceae bacterium]